MKKLIFFKNFLVLLSLSASVFVFAQTEIIVDNNYIAPNSQNDLQIAIDNATPGSVIYVQPSETTYPEVTINKKIKLIGRSSSDKSLKTNISGILLLYGASESSFEGLDIYRIVQETSNTNAIIDGISIKECKISYLLIGDNVASSSQGKNWTIQGNNIYNVQILYGTENIVLKNNILKEIFIRQPNGVTITQNVFATLSQIDVTEATNQVNVFNCIFIGNSNYSGTQNLCRIYGPVNLSNCLTYDYGTAHNFVFFDSPYDSYTSQFTAMKYNTNPLFVSVNPNPYTNEDNKSIANFFELNVLNDNLQLQATSPAKAAGQNGEDLGIYHNYDFRNLGYPQGIPVMKITNAPWNVPAGGALQITITASSQ